MRANCVTQATGKLTWLIGFCALALVAITGCGSDSGTTPTTVDAKVTSQDLAVNKLQQIDRGEEALKIPPLVYDLNRWSEQLSPTIVATWQLPESVKTLPKQLRDTPVVQNIPSRKFQTSDGYYLREAVWLRDLAKWVSSHPVAGPYEDAAPSLSDESAADREDLIAALRLFDWTVRNITIDATLPEELVDLYPELSDEQLASGATQLPWQAILSGRAGAWTRGRVFMLLARQMNIDTCVLAINDPSLKPNPFPWVIAVFVDDQPDGSPLLFDPVLGLPLFDQQGKFITLAKLQADPKLLELYSVGSLEYTITPKSLDSLVALIDAGPEALSPRMQLFEEQLVGEELKLGVNVVELIARAEKIKGVKEVRLWTAPFLAHQVFAELETQNPQWDAEQFLQAALRRGVFANQNALVKGRIDYIHGDFELGEDRHSGAKFWYMESRIPDRTLDLLPESKQVQAQFGLVKTKDTSQAAWDFQIEFQLALLRRLKLDATYFLGLIHFENGMVDVARNWWDDQLRKDEAVWPHAVAYQIARCYEAEGDLEKARELLIATEESPLQLGNFVRSRWLRLREENSK